jgi:putative flippase GtrA
VSISAPILIPAYRPGPQLKTLVEELVQTAASVILIIDDGSGPDYQQVFNDCSISPKVRILTHSVNLGKGAAIKSGIGYVLQFLPDSSGVITADADGQHHPDDILRVASSLDKNPGCLVLGVREFDRGVPLRSRIGNICTRGLVRMMLGQTIRDTQTGLRGLPRTLLPRLLDLPSTGYEYELDVLIACKHHVCRIVEEKIRTIYAPENSTSHFNPLRDSLRIYFVLFRFSILSLLSAALDNAVFYIALRQTGAILLSQTIGRVFGVFFNYGLARKAVFLSHERHRALLPRYLLLVICSGAASYGLIRLLNHLLGISPIVAKIAAESFLFIGNFVLQRDFVFTRSQEARATDWNRYYRSVPVTARLTRKYTGRVLRAALKRFSNSSDGGPVIVELGGANSCFLDGIVSELRPCAYHVVDSNAYGLDILRERSGGSPQIRLHRQDIMALDLDLQADVVFSVGLIEHFDLAGTRSAILRHFELLKPGGCAVLSFPTPTWLYRVARFLTELVGLWKFPDERPLSRREVLESLPAYADVVLEKTLWPLVYTQRLMVIRKRAGAGRATAAT